MLTFWYSRCSPFVSLKLASALWYVLTSFFFIIWNGRPSKMASLIAWSIFFIINCVLAVCFLITMISVMVVLGASSFYNDGELICGGFGGLDTNSSTFRLKFVKKQPQICQKLAAEFQMQNRNLPIKSFVVLYEYPCVINQSSNFSSTTGSSSNPLLVISAFYESSMLFLYINYPLITFVA